MQTNLSFTFTVKLISYRDEKEEKEAIYLSKLCRWREANLALKKLIWKRYIIMPLVITVKTRV